MTPCLQRRMVLLSAGSVNLGSGIEGVPGKVRGGSDLLTILRASELHYLSGGGEDVGLCEIH